MFLTDFVNSLRLSREDRDSLRRKRGLSDATIDALRFKSLGSYVEPIVRGLNVEAARAAFLLDENGQVNYQLLRPFEKKDHILIPYIGRDGEVTKIRPHSMGLTGDPSRLYSEFLINEPKGNTLIITEGEFKAAAAWQLGFNCVAVPGIPAFIKSKLPELLEFIHESGFGRVCILFDREIKDDPRYSNFKPDATKRHDTAIYAYIMARSIANGNIPVVAHVAELPAEWMVDGKADIDSAVAQGKTFEDFEKVINSGLPCEKFLEEYCKRIGKDMGAFVNRKVIRFYQNQLIGIRRHFNKYQVKRKDEWKDISNFTIDIVGKYYDAETDAEIRQIVFASDTGLKIGPFPTSSGILTSKQKLQAFAMGHGDFVFGGTDDDLMNIMKFEFNRTLIDKKMTLLNHCGRVDPPLVGGRDVWAFKEIALVDGKAISPDGDGVFWLDETTGFTIKQIQGVRYPDVKDIPIDLEKIKSVFFDLAGMNGLLLLGWAGYSILSNYAKVDDIYPFPFLYGEKASGKTTVCKCLMALFGLFDFGTQINDITGVALTRLLSFYSELPLWLDEFHNSKKVEGLEPFLKSVYNKSPVFRGTKIADQLVAYKIRSRLLLSGETIAKTDGVRSRSVMFESSIQGPQGKVALNWVRENHENMGAFTMRLLKAKDTLAPALKKRVFEIQDLIVECHPKADERMMRHFSFFAASYECVFGRHPEFINWLLSDFFKGTRDIIAQDEVLNLFDAFVVLHEQGKIKNGYFKIEDGEIFLWFGGVYDIWEKEYRGTMDIHDKAVLQKTIQKKPYYLRTQQKKILNQNHKCVVFDYATAPETLKSFADFQMETRGTSSHKDGLYKDESYYDKY